MKKLSKLVVLAASLIVASFVGCSDISSDEGFASAGYTDAKSAYVKKSLTLNVTSESDLIDFSTSTLTEEGARTIVPTALNSDNVVFYLGGTNLVNNQPITVQKVTFAGTASTSNGVTTYSKTEGTVTVDLEASNYRFVLVALQAESNETVITNLIKQAVLVGYATADLRYTEESASVNFVLSSDGLSGNGQLKLSLFLDNWSEASKKLTATETGTDLVINKAKSALYKVMDGSKLSNSEETIAFEGKYDKDNVVDYYGKSETSEYVNIPTGTYDFTVTFTLSNQKTYIYSEKIVILYNQKTEAVIGIPEVIELPPTAPKNFKVGYILPSTSESDYYKAVFNWEDTSNNELYFELDLYDVTTDTDVTAAKLNTADTWNEKTAVDTSDIKTYSNSSVNPSKSTHKSIVFYGLKQDNGPSWYAGSLNRNNEFAIFYLELGKRYLARIRAVNAAGNSEYATSIVTTADGKLVAEGTAYNSSSHSYAYSTPASTTYALASGESTAETASLSAAEGTSATTPVTVTAFNTHIINLLRVRYELNGGVFTIPTTLEKIYYFDQLTAGNPIMQPDGDAIVTLASGVINSDSKVYNNGAAITVKSASTDNGKPWTAWTINSIDTKKTDDSDNIYPSAYTKITEWTGYDFDTAMIYRKITTGSGTSATDSYIAVNLSEAPATGDYYKRTLAPYTGYENIVLYANYTASTFGVSLKNVEDYTIEKNLNITAKPSGTNSPKLVYNDDSGTKTSAASVAVLSTANVGGSAVVYSTATEITSNNLSKYTGDTNNKFYKRTGDAGAYIYTLVTDNSTIGVGDQICTVKTAATVGTVTTSKINYLIVNRTLSTTTGATEATYSDTSTVVTSTLRSDGKIYATRTGSEGSYTYAIVDLSITEGTAGYIADNTQVYEQTAAANPGTTTTAKVNNLVFEYNYNSEATNGIHSFGLYDKVLVEVIQQGASTGTSVGVYGPSATSFTIPLGNYKAGTYKAVFKAYTASNNNKVPYEYTVFFQLTD